MARSPEQYLISSVLRDRDMTNATSRGVTSTMFHAFPDEWEWIEKYYTQYRKVPTTNAFRRQFPEFTFLMVNDTGHFSDLVRVSHARFMLTGSTRTVLDLLTSGDVEGAVSTMHKDIISIASDIHAGANDTDILADWRSIYGEVNRRHQKQQESGMAGVPTGFPSLDDRTGGPQGGQVWIVSARLGQGKSWTMLRMALAAIMKGHRVQYDSLEQTRVEVGTRMHTFLSSAVGKSLFRNLDLMQGKNFSTTEYRRFLADLKTRIPGAMFVSDTSRGAVTPLTVASQIERNHPDVVFVDYLNLMKTEGARDWQSVAKLSGDMKLLASQYDIPLICAAQLNRDGNGRDAGASNLAEADAIGRDADVVLVGRQLSESVIVVKCDKNRHGPGGWKMYCDFRPSAGVFEEVTYQQAMLLKDKDDDRRDAEVGAARDVEKMRKNLYPGETK